MRKENTSCIRLSLIMLEFLIKVNKKYYPQTLLDECKYEVKENKIIESINDGLNSSSSDNESDNEFNNECND